MFRAGFAPTMPAARQLVNHGHVLLNDRLVNIASIRLRKGDVVRLTAYAKKIPLVLETVQKPALTRPEWHCTAEVEIGALSLRFDVEAFSSLHDLFDEAIKRIAVINASKSVHQTLMTKLKKTH